MVGLLRPLAGWTTGIATLAVMACSWTGTAARSMNPRPPESASIADGEAEPAKGDASKARESPAPTSIQMDVEAKQWTAVDSSTAATLAQAISELAPAQLERLGVSAERSTQFQADIKATLFALLSRDLDSYLKLMQSKGASLGAAAASYAERELARDEYFGLDRTLRSAAVTEKVRYLWAHPEKRNVAISRVGGESGDRASFGVSWDLDAAWGHGLTGVYSLFDTPGMNAMEIAQDAQNGKVRLAWVQMPVLLEGGQETTMRLTFAYSEDRRAWYPLYMAAAQVPPLALRPLF